MTQYASVFISNVVSQTEALREMMEQIVPSPNHHADFMISYALAVVVR